MATGYTHGVLDGKVTTLKDYLSKFFIGREEDEVKADRKPDLYHQEQLIQARKDLERAKRISLAEAAQIVEAEHQRNLKDETRFQEKQKVERKRLEDMLQKVEAWDAEGNEICEDIKKYAISQLKETIQFDCRVGSLYPTKARTPEEYIQDELDQATRDIGYHTKGWNEEVDRCLKQNEAVRILRKLK